MKLSLFTLFASLAIYAGVVQCSTESNKSSKSTSKKSKSMKGGSYTGRVLEPSKSLRIKMNKTTTEQELAPSSSKSKGKYEDLPYNPRSKTITNDVEWKDNNGNLLDVSRGGKISNIDGIFCWVGTTPFSSKVSTIVAYWSFSHVLLRNHRKKGSSSPAHHLLSIDASKLVLG